MKNIRIGKLILTLIIFILTLLLLIAGLKFVIGFSTSELDNDIETTTTTIKLEPTTIESTTKTSTTKKTTKKKTTKKITMNVNAQQQEILDYLLQETLNMGWTTNDYEAAVNIMIKESSINPNSVNKSSGACGLFQAYPCNKAIRQYPDYMNNYKSQVKWGLNYIKGRYTTPVKAWKFWQEHKWY